MVGQRSLRLAGPTLQKTLGFTFRPDQDKIEETLWLLRENRFMYRRLTIACARGDNLLDKSLPGSRAANANGTIPALDNAPAHFEMSGGRILSNNGNWAYPTTPKADADGDTHERISFNSNGATGSVAYSYQRTKTIVDDKKDVVLDLAIEFSSEGRFVLRYVDKDEPQNYFELLQTPGQPVRLSLPPFEKPRVLQAPTLWHLLIVHADDCRKSVLPRLEGLRPEWHIAATAGAVEDELVRLAGSAQKPDRQQWAAWVEQLGDPLCARRERADRKLRDAGPAVLGYLNQMKMDRLDAEQQSRIRRIVRVLSAQQGEDTPESVASILAGDPNVWLALLSRDDEAMRRAAVQQLELILNAPVKIDPKADPASQAKAREALGERIEKLGGSMSLQEK